MMTKTRFLTIICMSLLLVFVYGCDKGANNNDTGEASTPEQGEQAGHEGGEHGEHSEEGEEAGPRIALDGTHDEVRNGVRLILSYDEESTSFVGTMENVTEETIFKVRIEVHLSNGIELGPTPPFDLTAGRKVDVGLSAEGQTFEWWKAHSESGTSEH